MHVFEAQRRPRIQSGGKSYSISPRTRASPVRIRCCRRIHIVLIDEKDEFVSPLGAKGAGEIGITGAVAAIGNAVFHATGRRVRALPITLDKVFDGGVAS